MWMGRPVSVERTSRCMSDLWVVKRRNSGAGVAILVMACTELKSLKGLEPGISKWQKRPRSPNSVPPFLYEISLMLRLERHLHFLSLHQIH